MRFPDENDAKSKAVSSEEAVMVLVIGFLTLFALIAWEGYVVSCLWSWFIWPYFQVPYLTIPMSVGLILVLRFITQQAGPKETENVFVFVTCRPAVFLLIGWVVKTYFLT